MDGPRWRPLRNQLQDFSGGDGEPSALPVVGVASNTEKAHVFGTHPQGTNN
jgi:hypothetical protein